ncbi:hypothetical protein D9758_013621 [Tetrapyrgos nigripes]|uniref:Uncharacterized protein n=1 Tax=Tetrapyrgos nigripes TaxID=182062 RepID=A0A8H5CP86_9AGAR|nr:hypothetical protein D9758_013621 [Tetrapyrgos nigripes]
MEMKDLYVSLSYVLDLKSNPNGTCQSTIPIINDEQAKNGNGRAAPYYSCSGLG